ncbi:MAG: small ribosomal subunit Rsm22 family protein [Alphaproteobacteria bacterium]|nr:small ribosomal subunit Rsm22 family protein [Alphaproteobacteria bacterium]
MIGIADRITHAETLLAGLSSHELAARAARISAGYRDNLASRVIVRDDTDAAIYALMRMPATAAAVSAALDAFRERAPDFAPKTVVDAGAGPGTAGLCASEHWPEAELCLCDVHAGLLALAQRLMEAGGETARFVETDLARGGADLPMGDLVISSYALTELSDAAYAHAAENLWHAAAAALVVVEPGRPRDHMRLMDFRAWAIGQGAHVAAPCPHMRDCPLTGTDWCHFSVRLPRSRTHRRLKAGALGYEDEKVSYLVLTRADVALVPALPRVLASPEAQKHEIRFKLCEPDGEEAWRGVARKNPQFGRIRRVRWGDTLSGLDVGAATRTIDLIG